MITSYKKKDQTRGPDLIIILNDISRHYGLPISDILHNGGNDRFVTCRSIYCYVAYKLTNATLKQIGAIINKDHSMVIHYRDKVKHWIKNADPKFIDEWFDWLEGTELWGKYEKLR